MTEHRSADIRTSLRIRMATPDDWPQVQRIAHDTYVEHFAHCWSAQGLQRFLQRDFSAATLRESLASARHAWFIAQDEAGAPLGYAKVNWQREEPVSALVGAEVQKLYFRADAVGKGYGAALLEHVCTAALAQGEDRVWLDVLKSNVDAQRFYARHGFHIVGERPYRTDLGDDIGMWVMHLPLA